MQQPRARLVVVLTTLGTLLLVVLGASAATGPIASPAPGNQTIAPVTPPSQAASAAAPSASASEPPTPTGTPSPWPGRVLLGVLVLALLVSAYLVLRQTAQRLRQTRERERATTDAVHAAEAVAPEEFVAEVHESFAEALQRLRTGGRLDDVILECWRRLEDAATASGVPRAASQTSTEFTVSLLGATAAQREDLDTLARLYRQAMFADTPPGPESRDQAVTALEHLADDLSRSSGCTSSTSGADGGRV